MQVKWFKILRLKFDQVIRILQCMQFGKLHLSSTIIFLVSQSIKKLVLINLLTQLRQTGFWEPKIVPTCCINFKFLGLALSKLCHNATDCATVFMSVANSPFQNKNRSTMAKIVSRCRKTKTIDFLAFFNSKLSKNATNSTKT